MEKYTKKANAYIMKHVLKVDQKASGRTTFDQAYVMLMTEWDLEGDIVTTTTETIFKVWRDGEVCHTITWPRTKSFNEKEGDWDWDLIYKDVLEAIIKDKLYKRPKIGKRAAAKLTKEKEEEAKKAREEKEKKEAAEQLCIDIAAAKRRKDNLSVKISDWKKKGKDTSELRKELEMLKDFLKNNK